MLCRPAGVRGGRWGAPGCVWSCSEANANTTTATALITATATFARAPRFPSPYPTPYFAPPPHLTAIPSAPFLLHPPFAITSACAIHTKHFIFHSFFVCVFCVAAFVLLLLLLLLLPSCFSVDEVR